LGEWILGFKKQEGKTMWYVMVETIELDQEYYTRVEFDTFEEAQSFYEKTNGAWKPQKSEGCLES
jgi:hypothetical protein